MKKFSCLDCETGGLDPYKNALLSVAVVVLDEELEEIERFYSLVKDNAHRTVEDKALEVNGLTRREIYEQGVPLDQVMKKVCEMTEGTIPVFHNAAFDVKFLNVRGTNFDSAIDTMLLSWRVWPYPQKAKLTMVTERMGFAVLDAHNSLGDVLMTIGLLKEFSQNENYKRIVPDALIPKKIDFDAKPWDKR